jgi:hypothetical protein
MSDDHLKGEISVSAELTPTGVRAGAKSRFISAIDHLFGNAVDLLSPKLEGIAQRERARTAQDVKLIEAAGDRRIRMLEQDPSYEELVLQQQLKTATRRVENKAHTVRLAIEDLRATPPTEDQNATGADALDPDFLNRFERYAEDATTEQLRERWGRVLASEIRKPGTFSAKVMRVVDELDPETAATFEKLCKFRIGTAVPKVLVGELSFKEGQMLETADLLMDPNSGHMRLSNPTKLVNGPEVRMIAFESGALGVPMDAALSLPFSEAIRALSTHEGSPAVPIYLLTAAGEAIASAIIPNDPKALLRSLVSKASAQLGDVEVREFVTQADGFLAQTEMFKSGVAQAPKPPSFVTSSYL